METGGWGVGMGALSTGDTMHKKEQRQRRQVAPRSQKLAGGWLAHLYAKGKEGNLEKLASL